MSYATVQNAIDLYGEDYVDSSVARVDGEPDTTSLTGALAKASSEIDSYLSTRYDVPLTTVPEIVAQYAVDIAIYRASSAPGAGLTEEKRQRYEDAIRWLRDVSAGKAGLGLAETDAATEHLPQFASATRIFTRAKMSDL